MSFTVDHAVHKDAEVTVIREAETSPVTVNIVLNDTAAVDDMRRLLGRGLNTWDVAPKWMFELDAWLAQYDSADYGAVR